MLMPLSLALSQSFYNRVTEIACLQAILAKSPRNVLVLLGPPSCGKSGTLARLGE
jgi:ABC-type sugar transport system ATPase subunit